MKKKLVTIAVTAIIMAATVMTSLAGWEKDQNGWWYDYGNQSRPTNSWQWLDGNADETSECYYFDSNGYLLTNTTTPDGYQVNADGAWVVDGQVQTQVQGGTQAGALSSKEIFACLEARGDGLTTLIIDTSKPENVNGVTNIRVKLDEYNDGWKWQLYKEYYGILHYCAIAVNPDGYILVNTTTPDGYYVDQYGILTIDGSRVYHGKNCDVFPFWYDLIDMDGNVVTDKNNCDLNNIDVFGLKNVISDSAAQHIPWGKLMYNHCFYVPADGSIPKIELGFGDICVEPEYRPDTK